VVALLPWKDSIEAIGPRMVERESAKSVVNSMIGTEKIIPVEER